MYIRCWGSRGSIPVNGPEHVRYGGDTTCLEIRSRKGDLVVVDAGTGIRRLGEKLHKEGPHEFDLLFTHAHLDHVMGFPFFVPVYQEGTRIRIHGRPFEFDSYHQVLKGVMCDPYCPVDFEHTKATFEFNNIGDEPFTIGSLSIKTIMLSHPNGGVGFRFEEGGVSFVFLTDNELDYVHPSGRTLEEYTEFARGADLLIHDAEYTSEDYSRAWGHSVFESAVKMGIAAEVKRFGLFHINQRRTDDEMDEMVKKSRALVAESGSGMDCFAVSNEWEVQLG